MLTDIRIWWHDMNKDINIFIFYLCGSAIAHEEATKHFNKMKRLQEKKGILV